MTERPDPNPLPPELKMKWSLPEEDLIMLESLIRSPVFAALKRALGNYKAEALSVLENSKDTHTIFQTQGRLIGLKVIENLPAILVHQYHERKKAQETQAVEREKRSKRLKSQDPRAPLR